MQPDDESGASASANGLWSTNDPHVIALHAEEVTVVVRKVERSLIRVATVTTHREVLVDQPLAQERIEVERIPVGRYVDVMPPVREEGDLTIVPVIEEVVVVTRRLMLREEVHIRRIRSTEQHLETVQLRSQEAVITRTPVT